MKPISLFAEQDVLPGMKYEPALVGAAEQADLIKRIERLEFAPFQFQQWRGNRRVVWYGWRYDYGAGGLLRAPPAPGFLLGLREKAGVLAGMAPDAFEQALVTEYRPGAGIGWHRDRSVFDRVVGISLSCACTIRFRRRLADSFERWSLQAEPGSAYLLSGESRHGWEHSIAPLTHQRYSVTFRTLAGQAPAAGA